MNQTINILLCEADVNLSMVLADSLAEKGYAVDQVSNGTDAFQALTHMNYALCILSGDLELKSGMEVLLDLREIGNRTPVIFVSQNGSVESQIEAYGAGTDDFLAKPFKKVLLLCKIEAVLRRTYKGMNGKDGAKYKIGEFELDTLNQKLIHSSGEETHLSTKEAELLQVLAHNVNQLVERAYILKKVWNGDTYFNSRSLSVYMNRIRKVLVADPSVSIMSVHGRGYKMLIQPKA